MSFSSLDKKSININNKRNNNVARGGLPEALILPPSTDDTTTRADRSGAELMFANDDEARRQELRQRDETLTKLHKDVVTVSC